MEPAYQHISNIAYKANRSLGFIRRNMRACKPSAKSTAYQTVVRPTMEYASVVWDPYTQVSTTLLKKVQHRIARFVTGTTTTIYQALSPAWWKIFSATAYRSEAPRADWLCGIISGTAQLTSVVKNISGQETPEHEADMRLGMHHLAKTATDTHSTTEPSGRGTNSRQTYQMPQLLTAWRPCWRDALLATQPLPRPVTLRLG